jgi:spore coat polysaccharide biosynthesis predicted glycosyltransferase SpsG
MTRKVLKAVMPFCAERGISIDVVTGDGFGHIDELEDWVRNCLTPEIRYTHATGIMSSIMEQADLAICSNGRTVYELAHMNIPSIIFAHHEREVTHQFACKERGFVQLGMFQVGRSEELLLFELKSLIDDEGRRTALWLKQFDLNFITNKVRVVRKILGLLE